MGGVPSRAIVRIKVYSLMRYTTISGGHCPFGGLSLLRVSGSEAALLIAVVLQELPYSTPH
jgi:hypothetical protein